MDKKETHNLASLITKIPNIIDEQYQLTITHDKGYIPNDKNKHLCKMATDGSKEKCPLEKVKCTLEKVYQEQKNSKGKYDAEEIKKKEKSKTSISENLLSIDDITKSSITSKKNNIIVESKQELEKMVKDALSDNTANKNLHLGIIPNNAIARIKNEINEIKKEKIDTLFKDDINYALTINQDEIRHIKKDSMSIDDVINFVDTLDELVCNFDTVSYTSYNNSQNALRFKKNMFDGTHIALEVISNKNHTIRTHTLFLEKADFERNKKGVYPQRLMNK